MGGGGSYSRYSRRIPDNNPEDNCDKLHFITDLQKIQQNITKYNVDDILEVKLDVVNNIYVEGNHGICGYITAMSATQLIRCLKKGKQFIATILSISNTSCRVEVTPL
ncbi:hypothetical protein [Draconibacterium sediminis]|uniref:Uncharacterized protein n=1 Tax=Draconibacterium sediminis TaxID=1544798 RepID=A0A0D8J9K8_9BACT|nr:hypothetical protein [Draconibacterium sediminis]KJF43592.1 hypothetical protein LH29_10745 [Draconibacterium sediminis]